MTAMPQWLDDFAKRAAEVRPGRGLTRPTATVGDPRMAAVLVLFGDGPAGTELLLLERSSSLRSHAGQVAFPGGTRDDGDADLVATALREAAEETALDPAGVRVVAVLPELWLPPSDFMVTPVVGWWRDRSPVHAADPAETTAVHLLPVDALLDPANRGRVRHPSGYVGPAFQVGDVFVWGFTAGIIAALVETLGWERDWDRTRFFELPEVFAS